MIGRLAIRRNHTARGTASHRILSPAGATVQAKVFGREDRYNIVPHDPGARAGMS